MSTASQAAEIKLYNAMIQSNLTVNEAVEAMKRYANDKDFEEALDRVYKNDTLLTDEWDVWS
jgi:transcription termination factor NusB